MAIASRLITNTSITQVQEIIGIDPEHKRNAYAPEFEASSAFTQGEFRPIAEGVVPIQDAGFIHSDAAYDVVSASRGYMFRMAGHIDRFKASCDKFSLENPYSDDETVEILNSLVRPNCKKVPLDGHTTSRPVEMSSTTL